MLSKDAMLFYCADSQESKFDFYRKKFGDEPMLAMIRPLLVVENHHSEPVKISW